MTNDARAKHILISCIIAIIAVAALTIVAELYAPLKDWLKQTFSHHWIGKSMLALGVFLLFSFIMRIPTKKSLRELVVWLVSVTILCGLAIFIFFLWHFFS